MNNKMTDENAQTEIGTLLAKIRAWQRAELEFLTLKLALGFTDPQTRAAAKRLDEANEALGLGNTYFYGHEANSTAHAFVALADHVDSLQAEDGRLRAALLGAFNVARIGKVDALAALKSIEKMTHKTLTGE